MVSQGVVGYNDWKIAATTEGGGEKVTTTTKGIWKWKK